MFKYITLSLLLSTPTLAAETQKAPEKPVCGKTVEECQKVFESQMESIKNMQTVIKGLQTQRDYNAQQRSDLELNSWVNQQKSLTQ